MKKLSLSKINLQPDELMEKSQMAKITGGLGWRCYCYGGSIGDSGGVFFVGDGEESGAYALQMMTDMCGGSAHCVHVQ